MARQILGGLTTLNLSTNLDPMFSELYDASFMNALNSVSIGPQGTGTGQRALLLSGGTVASDGGVVVFRRGSTDSILIGDHGRVFGTGAGDGVFSVAGAFNQRFYTNGVERMRIDSTGVVRPGADNTQTLGAASFRWSVVYAGTGAINTSDAREKTQVHQLNAAELSAAKQIAREFGTYQFLSAVQEKQDAARMHAGTTVQRVIQIMESFGLDAMRYAFICYDEWDAEHDSDGNETRAAGNRYSFRPDELMMFVARGIAARQDELEARIAALEP